MIPTLRSGVDSPHKSISGMCQHGHHINNHKRQQQNSTSYSMNAPKIDGKKKLVISERNQNQCNSPVKRRSTSQIEVRKKKTHHLTLSFRTNYICLFTFFQMFPFIFLAL